MVDLRIFLIGPALLGGAHILGSSLSDDTRELVRKPPAAVYANVSQALASWPQTGSWQLEGAPPIPYRISVDRTPRERLVVHVMFNGRKAGQVDLNFTPANGGKETLIIAKVGSDGRVIREELAGTDKAKLGYAPDWLLTFAFGKSLTDAAPALESGTF